MPTKPIGQDNSGIALLVSAGRHVAKEVAEHMAGFQRDYQRGPVKVFWTINKGKNKGKVSTESIDVEAGE